MFRRVRVGSRRKRGESPTKGLRRFQAGKVLLVVQTRIWVVGALVVLPNVNIARQAGGMPDTEGGDIFLGLAWIGVAAAARLWYWLPLQTALVFIQREPDLDDSAINPNKTRPNVNFCILSS